MTRLIQTALILLVLLTTAHAAAAQEGAANATLARARQLIELGEMRGAIEAAAIAGYDHQMDLLRPGLPELSATEFERFRPYFVAELQRSMEQMLEAVSRIYASHFTLVELDELVAFYTSPVGRKALARSPLIAAQAEAVGATWGARVGLRALERFQREQRPGLDS